MMLLWEKVVIIETAENGDLIVLCDEYIEERENVLSAFLKHSSLNILHKMWKCICLGRESRKVNLLQRLIKSLCFAHHYNSITSPNS